MQDPKLIELLYYLSGELAESSTAFIDGEKIRPLADPIGAYLNEVNRFLFAGGIGVDVREAEEDDPRQLYITKILQKNALQPKLSELWRHGAITGEILACPRLSDLGYHAIDFYPATEFKPEYDGDRLVSVKIKAIRYKEFEGKIEPHRFKKKIDAEKFTDYPLVPISREAKYDWEANKTETPHNYRELPAIVIKNKFLLNQSRGGSEFNYASAKMAISAAMVFFDAVENVHFFGSPIVDSPNPKDTIKRLAERVRVLQKMGAEDGGGNVLLTPNAISAQHLELMERIDSQFKMHLGIRAGTQQNTTDTSSLSLRILNANTISKAEEKWLNYVDSGLLPLFQLILRMAAVDGILSAVSATDESSYALEIFRLKPYFSLSPQEQLQTAQVAMAWIDLGLDRTNVIHELIYPDLPMDAIEDKLRPNMEDV